LIPPFVAAGWLHGQPRDRLVPADVRFYLDGLSARAEYERGHIPSAVFVDLEDALCAHADPAAGGRHPLPEPEAFAAAMSALGIGDDSLVIAYDDAGGVMAARLVWMLRVGGHDAALLDGGLAAWEGELESGPPPARRPARFTSRPWPPEALATIADAAAPGDAVLLDARPRERYLGGPDALDPRAGHIPGARSVPARENVDGAGRLLPADALRARFAAAGIGPGTEVISSCGSGVTACHNLLALEHLGLGPGRLFPGSWSQWSRDPARPADTGQPDD
jgi:thiosulfate/3-mercaptopyruvate sulfurtransferase